MNTGPDKKLPEADSDIWNAINAFERILEVMPDDRTSLDTLVHAYSQLGDQARALEYLLRLGKVVAEEDDKEGVAAVLEQMEPFKEDPAVQSLKERLESLVERVAPAPSAAPPQEPAPVADPRHLKSHRINVTEEMSLAWDLLQAGEVTQEQYAELVQDLTNISSNAADRGGVSMLHVIENRGYGQMERILVFASQKGDLPIINLGDFEFADEAISLVPAETMVRQGVLPFDLLGPDVLVVVQNPYDLELRKQVEMSLGRRCHFFLAAPQDFNLAIGRVQKRLAELASKQPR